MLLTKAQLRECRKNLSPKEWEDLKNRRTGKSTALALTILGRAMTLPHVPVYIRDHYDTRQSNKCLFELCIGMTRQLGLDHFVFNTRDLTVKFAWVNPWYAIDEESLNDAPDSE